jgi:hypothetical protein
MDCLANKGVLDYNHQYREGYSPGSDQSAAWVNCFIKSFSSYYGSRTALADVAVVFPGQSLLASVSVFTMDAETSLYDYLGWAQALTDLHFQWDVLPDDQLSLERLKPFKAVVLPSAACLSDEAIDSLLGYLKSGDRLVVSGQAGTRHGLRRFLWHRDPDETLMARLPSSLGKDAHPHSKISAGHYYVCGDTPGKTFYMDIADGERSEGRSTIQEAVEHCVTGDSMQVTTDAPTTVGVFAFQERHGGLAIDLVNYHVDPPSDTLVEAKNVKLVVRPPAEGRFAGPNATLISPDLREAVEKTAAETPPTPWQYTRKTVDGRLQSDGALELTVPEFAVFCTISVPVE